MPEWIDVVATSGQIKHTDIVNWLKTEHGLTQGFANGIAQSFRNREESGATVDPVAEQYAGPKAAVSVSGVEDRRRTLGLVETAYDRA